MRMTRKRLAFVNFVLFLIVSFLYSLRLAESVRLCGYSSFLLYDFIPVIIALLVNVSFAVKKET